MDFGEYVKFYNIKSDNYKTKKILISLDDLNISNKFNFIMSVFSLYLSRINNSSGCLVKTFMPLEAEDSKFIILKISCPDDISFKDYLENVGEVYDETVKDIKSNSQDSLNSLSFYYIYDFTKYSKNDLCNEKGSALTLNIYEDYLDLVYNSDLFSDIYIQHMVENIKSLIKNVINSPNQVINNINILSNKEQNLLSDYCKGKTIDIDLNKIFSRAFRENAKDYPDAIAVDDGVNQVTYGELEKYSNSLAYDLSENYNLKRGNKIALMLPRTYHFPELVLALNKIGCAFIPVDMFYPIKRIEYMLNIAQADAIITTKEIAATYNFKTKVIPFEELNENLDKDVDIGC